MKQKIIEIIPNIDISYDPSSIEWKEHEVDWNENYTEGPISMRVWYREMNAGSYTPATRDAPSEGEDVPRIEIIGFNAFHEGDLIELSPEDEEEVLSALEKEFNC